MTIFVTQNKVGSMEKLTEPVTSDSELEEGEIASDDIEIISEIIRTASPLKATVKRRGPDKLPARLNNPIKRVKTDKPDRNSRNSVNSRNDSQKAHKAKPNGHPQRSPSRNWQKFGVSKPNVRQQIDEKISPKPKNSKKPTPKKVNPYNSSGHKKVDTKLPHSRQTSLSKEASPPKFETSLPPVSNEETQVDFKWRNSFELVSHCSVESMSIDSSSEADEEMELRLAALNSLNKEVTEVIEFTKSVHKPQNVTPEAAEEKQADEEDDDEELLRAQLLIEVGRKHTKEPEIQASASKQLVEPQTAAKEKPTVAAKTISAPSKKSPTPIQIPIAERLIIDLRNDSSESEDDEFEDSITALLKSARQTVESKDVSKEKSVIPQVLSHLPRNQQEEYQRLKEEIFRRESQRVNRGSKQVPSPLPEANNDLPVKSENSSVLPLLETPVVNSEQMALSLTSNVSAESVKGGELTEKPKPSTAVSNKLPVSSLKDSTKLTETTSSPRQSSLKQQLLRKKRDFILTKVTIKNQLELVDKQRVLWKNSNQEVIRLKALLQAAEESEQQHRTQLTNAQEQTQKLKTKMQTVEKVIRVLQGGIAVNRVRRTSTKSQLQVPSNREKNGAAGSSAVPPSTPLKVKPHVFTKALAKTPVLNVHKVKQSNIEQLMAKKAPPAPTPVVPVGKKAIHGENWLFGTLGDEWNNISEKNDYPQWKKTISNDKFRIDPARVLCPKDLDSTCQDSRCTYQHLPKTEEVSSLKTASSKTASSAS